MQNSGLIDWEKRFVRWLELNGDHSDGSHDLGHFQRVWKAARYINQEEGETADPLILLAAAYFHDLVLLPKNHPERAGSSRLSAEKTVLLLEKDFPDFPREKIEGVRHAIHAHSFSAGIKPLTAEARILQDADRMEAVGAIGLARVFYTAGQLGQRLFNDGDPMAEGREPDDSKYALDHFQVKLLKLPALMNTVAGRQLAEANADYLREFLKKIEKEIDGAY
ncbi:MAG TPA: phosphohydrolase [Puia sp.]|nr:phosphohydrolase [Puia sp.]